jgi:hypothetical protein
MKVNLSGIMHLQVLKELYCFFALPYINISCKPLIQRGIVLS